ncbi:MAG: F0F1 ATP synthase subunit B [Candidatus Riflebacteria bacterium]|nr:F0F1 ATP synthase subunit B [Candidatus Riflebacteria bacterium]
MEHFPTYSAIFLQILGFVVLFLLLKRFFFEPISAILNERERVVRERMEAAEKDRLAAAADREECDRRMRSIESEARDRIQDLIKEAQQARDELLSQGRVQYESILDKGRQEIQQEMVHAEALLRDRVIDLALLAAGRIIEKNLDPEMHHRLVDDVLDEIKPTS